MAFFSTAWGYLTGGWFRRKDAAPATLQQWADLLVEKIQTATATGQLTFLPMLDNQTQETQEIRDAYRVMMKEPIVKTALLSKVLAVAALDVQVHPPDKNNPEHVRQAAFVKYCLGRVHGQTRRIARNVLLPALVDGWSLNEKVWEVEEETNEWKSKWVWRQWKSKDTRKLDLGVDAYSNVDAIKTRSFNAGRLYDPDDFVLYSYLDWFENPRGMSDLRAAYAAYWRKKTAWELRGNFLDKFTSPFLLGSYTTPDVKAALDAALVKAKSRTWLTIPSGALVTAVEMGMKGTSDFESAIRDCDRDMLIAIVGAYLQVLEGKTTGARAMGKVHQDTSELFQWHLAAELGDLLTAEAKVLCRYNFAVPYPPSVTLEAVNEEALLVRSQVDLNLQKMGLKLSGEEAYVVYARAQPAGPQDALIPLATGAPPPAPALGQGNPASFADTPSHLCEQARGGQELEFVRDPITQRIKGIRPVSPHRLNGVGHALNGRG